MSTEDVVLFRLCLLTGYGALVCMVGLVLGLVLWLSRACKALDCQLVELGLLFDFYRVLSRNTGL